MRLLVLRDDDQAGRVLVEAVHDARPLHAADAGQVRAVGQQGVDQGAAAVAGPGCTGMPAGLLTTIRCSSSIDDVEGDRLGLRLGRDGRAARCTTSCSPPSRRSPALRRGLPACDDAAVVDQALGLRARDVAEARHGHVEALAGTVGVDLQTLAVAIAGSVACRFLRRRRYRPCAPLRRSRNDGPPVPSRWRMKKPTMTNSPMTIDESAMLNAG